MVCEVSSPTGIDDLIGLLEDYKKLKGMPKVMEALSNPYHERRKVLEGWAQKRKIQPVEKYIRALKLLQETTGSGAPSKKKNSYASWALTAAKTVWAWKGTIALGITVCHPTTFGGLRLVWNVGRLLL